LQTSARRGTDGFDAPGPTNRRTPTRLLGHDVLVKNRSALIANRRLIICCGAGGVGKTTTAAALAVAGARLGRRTCVVTVDPAKRLADAFGLDSLTNTPCRIDGAWRGELWATMLDTKSTFDDAITRYARDEGQAQAIMRNPLYCNLRDALSGTQEYMAVEKLYQLDHEGNFDLIIVDTPPTRHAMDFLSAPRHLTRLLDNPAIRMLALPSRAYLRAVSVAAQAPLGAIRRIIGAETFLDVVAFLRAFDGMEAGIRRRANRVDELFAESSTAFVLVAAPRQDAIADARLLAARLAESGLSVQALIINRLHSQFDLQSDPMPSVGPDGDIPVTRRSELVQAFFELSSNWAQLRAIAEREEKYVMALSAELTSATVFRVPFLGGDIHDVSGVQIVADCLFGPNDSANTFAKFRPPPHTATGK
jgi:anion-transporting  ArsA/GET3 family ATPase